MAGQRGKGGQRGTRLTCFLRRPDCVLDCAADFCASGPQNQRLWKASFWSDLNFFEQYAHATIDPACAAR